MSHLSDDIDRSAMVVSPCYKQQTNSPSNSRELTFGPLRFLDVGGKDMSLSDF